MKLQHLAATLAALWAGVMIGVGYVCAPIIFKLMPDARRFAGTIAGDAFTAVAYISLGAGVAILLIVRHVNKHAGFSTPNAPLILVFAALFLTIVGQFVIHPEVVKARELGVAALSFGVLHAISNIVYLLELGCVLLLNWSLYKPVKKPEGIESAIKTIDEDDLA